MMNLCLNSVHAMESAGHLEIQVRDVAPQSLEPQCLELAVCDTGRGIPEEDLEQIFEPFFTTRRDQGGTGVGLANVRQIVERWMGRIEVDSVLGEGTCVRVIVPI